MAIPRMTGGPRLNRQEDRCRGGRVCGALALILAAIVAVTMLSSCAGSRPAAAQGSTSSTGAGSSTSTTHHASSNTTVHPTTSTTQALQRAKVVEHGSTNHKWIALTFDDNYQEASAYRTLKVLETYHVAATFFVIGHYVDTGPKLAKAIAEGGFEVGDHTRSHSDCPTLSKGALRIEIGNGTDHYHALTGAPTVPLFRPPYGDTDQKTEEVAAEKGFRYVVLWDVDTEDWRGRTSSEITHTVLTGAHNGAIVLMHVAAAHTAEALPGIIEELRARGYELVTVSKLLGMD